jgi:hypothetical protein
MTLARAGWPEKKSVLVLENEIAGGQLKDQATIRLLVKVEIESIERGLWIAKTGLLAPSFPSRNRYSHAPDYATNRPKVPGSRLPPLTVPALFPIQLLHGHTSANPIRREGSNLPRSAYTGRTAHFDRRYSSCRDP